MQGTKFAVSAYNVETLDPTKLYSADIALLNNNIENKELAYFAVYRTPIVRPIIYTFPRNQRKIKRRRRTYERCILDTYKYK